MRIIRTPDGIFRAEQRDIYFLNFKQKNQKKSQKTLEEMQAWFAKHLPDSPTELMGPSEQSGFIAGGPVYLRIAFIDADLATFSAQWENAEGFSLDPRFQCCIFSYDEWWAQHGHYTPTFLRPDAAGVSVWIETPQGILCHVVDEGSDKTRHPATARTLWANACKQWPELKTLKLENLRCGEVIQASRESNPWSVIWSQSLSQLRLQDEESENLQSILTWLRLPLDTKTYSD